MMHQSRGPNHSKKKWQLIGLYVVSIIFAPKDHHSRFIRFDDVGSFEEYDVRTTYTNPLNADPVRLRSIFRYPLSQQRLSNGSLVTTAIEE
jgi:hypothetical protein